MKRVSVLMLALILCLGLCVPASAAEFSDVPDSSPFAASIAWAAEKGIANGTTPTTFAPGATCTTSHILTFLWRASGRPGDAGNERAAVTAWASGLGIDVSSLGTPCTRAAAVTYMWKAAGTPAPTQMASFTDVPLWSKYAYPVSWAVQQGITNGTGGETFSPEATCTRGQIVTFLYRAMNGTSASGTLHPPAESETKPVTVDVTSSSGPNGIAWNVPDNGYGTGYLNNGKPITEENIAAMLADAEKLWPTGMKWTDPSAGADNNYYGNPGKVVSRLLSNQYGGTGTSPYYACGAFAAMISDYLFGKTGNPSRELTDKAQIHPGDIIVSISKKDGTVYHVTIATSSAHAQTNGFGDSFDYTNGNSGKQVDWDCGMLVRSLSNVNNSLIETYHVFTRWPD